ncbi:MAG: hypothetical protein ACM3TR_07360 [Caulobacteraceae bacterium]
MNEALIKKVIKYKMDIAGEIVDCLPLKVSEEIKNLGRIVIEGLNESFQEMKEQPPKKSGKPDKLNKVTIE